MELMTSHVPNFKGTAKSETEIAGEILKILVYYGGREPPTKFFSFTKKIHPKKKIEYKNIKFLWDETRHRKKM